MLTIMHIIVTNVPLLYRVVGYRYMMQIDRQEVTVC